MLNPYQNRQNAEMVPLSIWKRPNEDFILEEGARDEDVGPRWQFEIWDLCDETDAWSLDVCFFLVFLLFVVLVLALV